MAQAAACPVPAWACARTSRGVRRAGVAGITALLFFGSVVVHEFAHSLVARRFRMSVSSITLFLLGGVASLTKEPPSAKAEFFMAIAGPATSLVIGGLCLGISQVVTDSL